ncbi:hypothetical protein ABPG74_011812 [Tetrahymena malaccensis]
MIKNSFYYLSKQNQRFFKYQLKVTNLTSYQNNINFKTLELSQQAKSLQFLTFVKFSSMDKKKQTKKGASSGNQKEEKKNEVSNVPASIYEKGGKFFISIHAKPNSKISQISGISDEGVDINIAAPPKDGEANSELIDYISQVLGVKKSSLSLDKGGKSRNKLMEISDSGYADVEELYQALKDSIQ